MVKSAIKAKNYTYVIFTDFSDELLSFVHGVRGWGKNGKSLLVYLTDRYACF